MTTALSDPKTVMDTIMQGGCEAYLTKPIEFSQMQKVMTDLGLL